MPPWLFLQIRSMEQLQETPISALQYTTWPLDLGHLNLKMKKGMQLYIQGTSGSKKRSQYLKEVLLWPSLWQIGRQLKNLVVR